MDWLPTDPSLNLDAMEDEERSWLERFEFIQPLGSGGMGEVYLAEDNENNKQLCVIKKILNEKKGDLLAQAEMLRMGQREAEFLNKLNHRGIVRFLDDHYSPEENGYYVVMEYVPGHNLEEVVVKEGSLDSETVVRIALQCCDVLEYLHSFDPPVIYRDLKPSNLMLRPDGLVVFIDFGIARDKPKDGPATRVVTSGYSPPEQYFGKPEARGDLYSLGATMHHLLTGLRPKPLTACRPMQINAQVRPELDRLIFQMTAHDKDQRPPSARAVQYELFRIYKIFHPEFEIPNLDDALEAQAYEEDQEISRASINFKSNLRTEKEEEEEEEEEEEVDEDQPDTSAGGNQRIVSKVKQWFENLTGKKSD